jgi:hypothetical protein
VEMLPVSVKGVYIRVKAAQASLYKGMNELYFVFQLQRFSTCSLICLTNLMMASKKEMSLLTSISSMLKM